MRLPAVLLLLLLGFASAQQPATNQPAGATQAAPAAEGAGPGEQGRRGPRRGDASRREEPAAPDRRGIAVSSELVNKHCASCHARDAQGLMTRISYQRKSPEGWELTLKRMLRQHHLVVTPDEAREMLAYLANDHGLTRTEAARGLYDSERRVHWSEAGADQELRESCGGCHSLGRVMNQQRDATEWKLLKAMHLAFFPLARSQAFRGGQRRENMNFESMTDAEREAAFARMRGEGETGPDRADRVLDALTKSQGLFTPEWEAWQIERRPVPLAGRWSVTGHEVGRGDFRGSVQLEASGPDAFTARWTLTYGDGTVTQRTGRGVLYAGYSWRGRSQVEGADAADAAKEVLLLDESWSRLEGRMFHGAFGEIGADVKLVRDDGRCALLALEGGALEVPAQGHVLRVFGQNFPADVRAEDFHAGRGVKVTAAVREDAGTVRLTVDTEFGAELGPRRLAFRADPGLRALVLYDTVDFIRIEPGEGFARVGGIAHPKQFERFEARAMHRGPDKKPWTADDVPLFFVPARWKLEEMPVSEVDDDVHFVGSIDAANGVFTPNVDGPNRERRYFGNNIGDVYVHAETTLDVWKRPPEPKVEKPERSGDGRGEGRGWRGGEGRGERREAAAQGAESAQQPAQAPADPSAPAPTGTAAQPAAAPPPAKPVTPTERERKLFRARGHLLVTVPIYVQWDRYDWDSR